MESTSVLTLILLVLFVVGTMLNIYGTIISFKKGFWKGIASLVVPGFATVVGLYKLVTGKDLIQ